MLSGNAPDSRQEKLHELIHIQCGPVADQIITTIQHPEFPSLAKESQRLVSYLIVRGKAKRVGVNNSKLGIDDAELAAIIGPATQNYIAAKRPERAYSYVARPFIAVTLARLLEAARHGLAWGELTHKEQELASLWADLMDESGFSERTQNAPRIRRGSSDPLPVVINLVLWWARTGGYVPWF